MTFEVPPPGSHAVTGAAIKQAWRDWERDADSLIKLAQTMIANGVKAVKGSPADDPRRKLVSDFINWVKRLLAFRKETIGVIAPTDVMLEKIDAFRVDLKAWIRKFESAGLIPIGYAVPESKPKKEETGKYGWIKYAIGGVIVVSGIYGIAQILEARKS